MENNKKWWLGIAGALLLGAGLVIGGIVIGQQIAGRQVASGTSYGPSMMAALSGNTYGPGMMQFVTDGDDDDDDDTGYPYGMGPGMMGHRDDFGMHGRGGFGPGPMWGDDSETGHFGYGMMGSVYREEMHAAIAEVLGLSVEDLEQAMWEDGKSMWQLIEEQGMTEDEFIATMQEAHDAVLGQMVEDGTITQEQADWMSEHMAEGPDGPGHCLGWQTTPDDGIDA